MSDSLRADHYLELWDTAGETVNLIWAEDFLRLAWSHSLNAVDTLQWTLPHTCAQCDDLDLYQGVTLWRRSHPDGTWYREWHGLLLTITRQLDTVVDCTALSLDWWLQQRVVAWPTERARRTLWIEVPTAQIVTDLVDSNLGPAALAAQGRWADGTVVHPSWVATAGTDGALLTHVISGETTVFAELQSIAGIRDAAWQIAYDGQQANLQWRVRPWGTDRTTGTDTLRLSQALDNIDTSKVTEDRAAVATRAFVTSPQTEGMAAAVHTAQLPGVPVVTETMARLYSTDVSPAAQAAQFLASSLSGAYQYDVLPAKVTALRYPDAYRVGDRIAVDLGTVAVALDVEGMRGRVSPRQGETIKFDFKAPVGGRFAA